MIELDNAPIEILCPKCGFYNKIRLKQVRLRDVIICRGCKRNINLDDHMNEIRRARRKIKQMVNSMIRSLNKI